MKKAFLVWVMWYAGVGRVMASEPEYSSSPSAQVQLAQNTSVSCRELVVEEGEGDRVPAEVKFKAEIDGDERLVEGYRFHFGDGMVEDGENQIVHEYSAAGEYEAYVELKLADKEMVTSDGCRKTVKVKGIPLVMHRSSCEELVIVSGNNEPAGSEAVFELRGADNKGKLQNYRLDFGDGEVVEQEESTFVHVYGEAGTYEVKGEVKDSEGEWVGDSSCRVTVEVETAMMKVQPETGAPSYLSLMAVVMIGLGLLGKHWALLQAKEER